MLKRLSRNLEFITIMNITFVDALILKLFFFILLI